MSRAARGLLQFVIPSNQALGGGLAVLQATSTALLDKLRAQGPALAAQVASDNATLQLQLARQPALVSHHLLSLNRRVDFHQHCALLSLGEDGFG